MMSSRRNVCGQSEHFWGGGGRQEGYLGQRGVNFLLRIRLNFIQDMGQAGSWRVLQPSLPYPASPQHSYEKCEESEDAQGQHSKGQPVQADMADVVVEEVGSIFSHYQIIPQSECPRSLYMVVENPLRIRVLRKLYPRSSGKINCKPPPIRICPILSYTVDLSLRSSITQWSEIATEWPENVPLLQPNYRHSD